MPWVRRSHESHGFYWIIAGVAAILIGVFVAYSWRSETASIVNLVEQQLGHSQAEVRMLEKRVKALEAKLGIDGDAAESETTAQAY